MYNALCLWSLHAIITPKLLRDSLGSDVKEACNIKAQSFVSLVLVIMPLNYRYSLKNSVPINDYAITWLRELWVGSTSEVIQQDKLGCCLISSLVKAVNDYGLITCWFARPSLWLNIPLVLSSKSNTLIGSPCSAKTLTSGTALAYAQSWPASGDRCGSHIIRGIIASFRFESHSDSDTDNSVL